MGHGKRTLGLICFEQRGFAWTQLIIEDAARLSTAEYEALTQLPVCAKERTLVAIQSI